ncbi:hypothetical protein PORY_002202 [Pneumocystis oryctolagi]|uniref:Uncharacterized protein n=1 Tax=Pneumocystis oryctolagi TaxID=42067 RepID=A0ACB7CBQ1_9ASCO|nr:hypothetical protein PORY_002202 [Pneumocystis oryctolagi]
MGSDCSIPGCITTLLRLLLPKSFSISYSPSTNGPSGICKTVDSVLGQVPDVISTVTQCLNKHNISLMQEDSNKGPEDSQEGGSNEQDPSQPNEEDVNKTDKDDPNKPNSTPKRLVLQGCLIM